MSNQIMKYVETSKADILDTFILFVFGMYVLNLFFTKVQRFINKKAIITTVLLLLATYLLYREHKQKELFQLKQQGMLLNTFNYERKVIRQEILQQEKEIAKQEREILAQEQEIITQREEIRHELEIMRQEKMEIRQAFDKMRQEKLEIKQELEKMRQEKLEIQQEIGKIRQE